MAFRPASTVVLLSPSFRSALGFVRRMSMPAKLGAILAVALIQAGCFYGWAWVIDFVMSVEGIGTAVADRLLAFFFLLIGGMLTFSAMLAALGVLFLSPEVALLRTLPTPAHRLYPNRFFHTALSAAWMVVFFGIGILAGHWYAMEGRWDLFIPLVIAFLAFVSFIVNFSSIFVTLLVQALPAQKARHLVMILSTFLLVGLVAMVRVLRPERLSNPETFENASRYLAVLGGPGVFWLPSDWVYQVGMASLREDVGSVWFYSAYLIVTAWLSYLIAGWLYEKSLDKAYTKVQEVALSPLRKGQKSWLVQTLVRRYPVSASLALKEGREFVREPNQVVQLFILAALVGLYLYNFQALQLQGGVLTLEKTRNMLAFFNMALASFVLGAVAQRLFFMRHGADPKAAWVIRTMPVSVQAVFRYELWSAFVPLLVMESALLIVSGVILKASPDLMVLAIINAPAFAWLTANLCVFASWKWPPQGAGSQLTLGGVVLVLSSLSLTVILLVLERAGVWFGFAKGAMAQGIWALFLIGILSLGLRKLGQITRTLYLPT